jgi:hypothetical protein
MRNTNCFTSQMTKVLLCLVVGVLSACGGVDPDFDRDGDGIQNGHDACPDEAEDADGVDDADGCPDTAPPPPPPDTDGDSIPDTLDACPTQPETYNGHQDSDGCPDVKPVTDTDGDGVHDGVDSCPSAPETVNGHRDTDGCPDVHAWFNGTWTGTTTIQISGEGPLQFTGTTNGTANGFQAILSPICPAGDGTMATTAYRDQFNVDWSGTLACAPVALNCPSVVFTFTSASFSLNPSTGRLGAAGGGSASGCGITKAFTMTFSGARQ